MSDLWAAMQERLVRERKYRLAELFTAARDADLTVGVETGQLKVKGGSWKLPAYIETVEPVRTPQTRDAMLAKLAALFPGMVRRGDA